MTPAPIVLDPSLDWFCESCKGQHPLAEHRVCRARRNVNTAPPAPGGGATTLRAARGGATPRTPRDRPTAGPLGYPNRVAGTVTAPPEGAGGAGVDLPSPSVEPLTSANEIFGFSTYTEKKESKNRAEIIERNVHDPRRHVLADREMPALIAIETGADLRKGETLGRPLHPWPSSSAMIFFVRVASQPNGSVTLASIPDEDLEHVRVLQDRRLVIVGGDPAAEPALWFMSQPEAPRETEYPGASRIVPDGPLAGRWIEVPPEELSPKARKAAGLPMLVRIPRQVQEQIAAEAMRKCQSRRRPANEQGPEGVQITVRELCTEMNRIRSHRDDLAGFKWFHVETARLIVNRLTEDAHPETNPESDKPAPPATLFREVWKPQRRYHNNEWHSIPRTYAWIAGVVIPKALPAVPKAWELAA